MGDIIQKIVLSALALSLVTGCGTTSQNSPASGKGAAPSGGKFADAGKYSLSVLMDPGLEGLPANEANSRKQISDWMGGDAVRVFAGRGGYKTQLITSKDKFTAGPDTLLLTVKIVKYNPGSKAARMIVGFGAGSCSLDIHYELHGAGKDPILSADDGVGSSVEWNRLARKLNENMLRAVNAKLASAAK
jgi:hypothetical protein